MTVTAALLLYVVAVLSIGPKLLVRITADGGAPRLAIMAWLTAVMTVLGVAIAVRHQIFLDTELHTTNSPLQARRLI